MEKFVPLKKKKQNEEEGRRKEKKRMARIFLAAEAPVHYTRG